MIKLSEKRNTTTKPDFIGIGLMKSGTTWLHYQLQQHPEIYMPAIKEMRYFLEGDMIPSHSTANLLLSPNWHYRAMRRNFFRRIKSGIYRKEMLSYYFHSHTMKWYAEYFDQNKICGEITPDYYRVSNRRLKFISEHFPHLKVILLLREPVSRVWSQCKMDMSGRMRSRLPEVDSIAHPVIRKIISQVPSYNTIIERWQKHFKQVGVFYFDDLKNQPDKLLNNVLEFLECDTELSKGRDLQQKINVGSAHSIPSKLKLELTRHYLGEIEALVEKSTSDIPKKWLDGYRLAIERATAF
jgi:hypothetical protein